MQRSSRLVIGGVVAVFVLLIAAPLLGSLIPSGGDAGGGAGAGVGGVATPTASTAGQDSGGAAADTTAPAVEDTAEPRDSETATVQPETAADTATAVPAETDSPQPAVVTDEPTPTATATPEPDALRSANLSAAIADRVNAERSARGLSAMATTGTTVRDLETMARNHSRSMAELGYATHYNGDNRSADRYRRNELYTRCQFESNAGEYVVTAELDRLETLSKVDASSYVDRYDDPDALSEDLPREIVDDWFDSSSARETLTYENAERVGVGLEITPDDQVYVTVNLC